MQPLEAHREAMPEKRSQGTGPELLLGELPGDDQRRAAEGKDLVAGNFKTLLPVRYPSPADKGCR